MKKHVLRAAKLLSGGALVWAAGLTGTPASALCQLQYTGKAAQMFGSAPRGSFSNIDACNAYRNSRPSFERTNSRCVGCYPAPESYQQRPAQSPSQQPSALSPQQKAIEQQQQKEKLEKARLKREQEHKERMQELEETAKKIEFQRNKEKMLSQFKDGRGGSTLDLEAGALPFKPGRAPGADKDAFNIPEYLADVKTALKIGKINRQAIVIYLIPNARAEAQKKLLFETSKTIIDAVIAKIHADLEKLQPFERDTEYDKQRKREEAERHAVAVEKLRYEAYIEARALAEELRQSDIEKGEIQVVPGDAMSQLLQVAEKGEW